MKFFILFIFSSAAMGAAYTPNQGNGILIAGLRSFEATNSFDQERNKKPNSNNGKFEKSELSYFFEYGLGKKLSIIANGVIYTSSEFKSNSFETKSGPSLGDQSIGIKQNYLNSLTWAQAWQVSLSFPLYPRGGQLLAGNHQHDLELRHHWDYLGRWLDTFQIFELYYRVRFDQPADEVHFDYTIGKNLNKFTIYYQSLLTYGLKNHSSSSENANTNLSSDFDLLTFTLNGVYSINKEWSVSTAFSQDVWGRSVSNGKSLSLSIWKKF